MRPISSPNSSSSGSRSMSPAVGKCFIQLQYVTCSTKKTRNKTRGIINEATIFCLQLVIIIFNPITNVKFIEWHGISSGRKEYIKYNIGMGGKS